MRGRTDGVVPAAWAVVVLLGVTFSCIADGERRPQDSREAASKAPTRLPAASGAAVALDTTPAIALVLEFVTRDARGERLKMGRDSWFVAATDSAFMEGYDSFTAIEHYRVDSAWPSVDTIFVRVTYEVAGRIHQKLEDGAVREFRFASEPRVEAVTFPVVLGSHGLKIVPPDIDQHVLVTELLHLEDFRFSSADRVRLQSIARKE